MPTPSDRYIVRFRAPERVLHLALMISFLGLAATGLPLLFSESPWARVLARLFGGFVAAGRLHRMCAILLIAVFAAHVGRILYRLIIRREAGMLWGPDSMVPQPRDFVELYRHVQWFVGAGPRPAFDRYTYWERFDYWAVFWGMFIIGGSGLMLWFPEAFARVLPGWMFNIALLVHGEEALLAVGFIFTIHFFNGHIRPEKFPMDIVIFTGVVPEHEFLAERSLEAERLAREGTLDTLVVAPPSAGRVRAARAVGAVAILTGLTLVVLIAYALLTGEW